MGGRLNCLDGVKGYGKKDGERSEAQLGTLRFKGLSLYYICNRHNLFNNTGY